MANENNRNGSRICIEAIDPGPPYGLYSGSSMAIEDYMKAMQQVAEENLGCLAIISMGDLVEGL